MSNFVIKNFFLKAIVFKIQSVIKLIFLKFLCHYILKTTDENKIESEEGVNAYKGIFFAFAFVVYGRMDKQFIAYGS